MKRRAEIVQWGSPTWGRRVSAGTGISESGDTCPKSRWGKRAAGHCRRRSGFLERHFGRLYESPTLQTERALVNVVAFI